MINITLGDCVVVLKARNGPLFDACVTDAPYHLQSIVKRFGGENAAPAKAGKTGAYARAAKGFMGKDWDGGDVAFNPETWRAIYDQLKPGAHLVAFSGARTYHRMACAIEDAGFEIRDQLQWLYGSGFPKSHDVSKAIDKVAGHWRGRAGNAHENDSKRAFGQCYERTVKGDPITAAAAAAWQGWGTALKPSAEPICLARKPLSEKTIAANVLKWGTGAINIDACRVKGLDAQEGRSRHGGGTMQGSSFQMPDSRSSMPAGRWPANVIQDGSDEVLAGFPDTVSGKLQGHHKRSQPKKVNCYGDWSDGAGSTFEGQESIGDSGSAARFFYSAKAGPLDRLGSEHATVKPVDLMRWLVRLVTPPGGLILEPFAGSGKTGIAAMVEGFDCEMIDLKQEHVADIERQLAILRGESSTLLKEHLTRAQDVTPLGGLFA